MRTEYKRDLQNNYLILEVAEVDAEDGYGLRMAEQNQVKGLLPMHESRRDGKLYLHYEITSRQTLESVYEKKTMSYQDILAILSGIRDTLEDMRKYLLSPQKLLFAPELIYVPPEKKGLQLCYYAKEDEYPITMLAEFILKRLDHRDRQAVTLGYGFFQQANSANFSLTETLKEIFVGIRMTETGGQAAVNVPAGGSRIPAAAAAGTSQRAEHSLGRSADRAVRSDIRSLAGVGTGGETKRAKESGREGYSDGERKNSAAPRTVQAGGTIRSSEWMSDDGLARNSGSVQRNDSVRSTDSARRRDLSWGTDSVRSSDLTRRSDLAWSTDSVRSSDSARSSDLTWGDGLPRGSGTGGIGGWNASPGSGIGQDEEEKYLYDAGDTDEDGIPVIHRERKRQKNRRDLADWLFGKVHPAVLLSFLLLMIGLELVFAFEILGLTEAGGCFFLILTVEMLINHRVLRKEQDDQDKPDWEEEENEDYERIMQEVYQQESRVPPEMVEETRCLIPDETEEELCLVRAGTGAGMEGDCDVQDIHPGTDPVYIGKIRGEADVILHASTVSRMHARIQIREGKCFLKDMNSKNGTFVNGERLTPQEEREIVEGDTVSFADMEYQVTKGRSRGNR
ncbi:MAG: FHA domain-containing protein [Lachnospiraceae bacterium]|nr:FHA domain-containing protein [Lachnospiraceae bacterium]